MSGMRACRASLRAGSRSFAHASLLLPRHVRGPACTLYAFCRAADDLADGSADGAAGLAEVRRRLDAIHAGAPRCAQDAEFARVVAASGLPRAWTWALVESFEWDVAGCRYEDLPALLDYAMRVAGSVGVLMALIMGVRAPVMLAAAADLGCAMQLTNIARDVGEDARAGRLYLPLSWLREEGVDLAAFLAVPRFTPGLGRTTARVLDEAARLYASSDAGIAALPIACRPAIRAARLLYAAIGDAVAARGHDSVSARARVPYARTLALLGTALVSGLRTREPLEHLVSADV